MKQIFLSLLIVTCICFQAHSQLTVADDNNVGIGVTTPLSDLTVGGAGEALTKLYVEDNNTSESARAAKFYKATSGGTWSFASISKNIVNSGSQRPVGGYFYAYNSSPLSIKRTYGVYSTAGNATNGFNYAVWARLAGSNNGAALFATTGTLTETNTGGVYAGYFRGDVLMENDLEVQGTYTNTSDINLKKDIRPLSEDEVKQIDKLNTLTAIKYKFKTPAELNDFDPEVLDTMKIDPRNIEYTSDHYISDQIGLSAQEVQLVYPELVKEGNKGYLTLNYVGLIPVLIEAIKEQDEALQIQATEMAVLRDEIEKLKNPESTTEPTEK